MKVIVIQLKMKLILFIALVLCSQTFSLPCGSSCYESSSCTSCTSSCCPRSVASCCSRGRSSCCPDGGTACCTSCCRYPSRCDRMRCGDDSRCCSETDVQTSSLPPSPPVQPTASIRPPIPPPEPERSTQIPVITPYPVNPPYPVSPPYPVGSSNSSSTNNNNNTITIPTNITIQNEVRSETRISIPVSIDVNNINNINIRQETETTTGNCSGGTGSVDGLDGKCINRTVVVTVTVPVTVRVPVSVPRPVPIPYVVTVPNPVPVPVGCCQVVSPCRPYVYGGCQTSSVHCSDRCSSSYMYQPINVCDTGCYRREMAMGSHCGYGGCFRGRVDCSMCNSGFYNSYDNFMMCAGCYMPFPWGMGRRWSLSNLTTTQQP